MVSSSSKNKTIVEWSGVVKPNNCRKVFFSSSNFARGVLVIKKLEIEKTKPTLYSTFKIDIVKVCLVFWISNFVINKIYLAKKFSSDFQANFSWMVLENYSSKHYAKHFLNYERTLCLHRVQCAQDFSPILPPGTCSNWIWFGSEDSKSKYGIKEIRHILKREGKSVRLNLYLKC